MQLYHFTRCLHLSAILAIGLDEGDIPISQTVGVNGVCLTEFADCRPTAQAWARGGEDKLEYRLTVEIAPDERLIRLKYVPDKLRMDRAWWRHLTEIGNGDPYKWWVYFGVIPADNITQIWDTERQSFLSDEQVDSLRVEPKMRGKLPNFVETITFQEALREQKLESAFPPSGGCLSLKPSSTVTHRRSILPVRK